MKGSTVNFRLSVMMLLQYAIWGAWLPILYPYLRNYLGFTEAEVANIFAVGAVGAIIGPFIAGQLADRWFATERYLGVSHLIGALLIWQLARIDSYDEFMIFSLIYSVIYSPTLSLTNSLAFHHIKDRDRDFSRVRVWGTVGWILVGIGVGQCLLHVYTPSGEGLTQEYIAAAQDAGRGAAFKISAILGVVMGVFCFFLPHTPPQQGKQAYATGEALGEIRRQPLITLFLLAVPISCIHQFYFVHTSGFLSKYQLSVASEINTIFGVGGGGLMTIGQMAEIAVLGVIPVVSKTLSRKNLLTIGIAAYGLRMFLFGWVDVIPLPVTLTLILGVALHGLCFGCFIFVAFMIVDEETTGDVRASAQSLFNLVIIGIGIIVGSQMAGLVAEWATGDAGMNYRSLFSVPMWASLACLLLLLLFYPGGRSRVYTHPVVE